MPFLNVRDLEIYYETGGAGPRLLYVSGSGGDLRKKPSVFDGPLGQHFEVLAYDQRGLGRSGKPDNPYSMADYAEDAAALLRQFEWEPCAVMGVSFGGMVAQEIAIRFPDLVERLVLACTSSGGAGGPSYPLHELAELPTEERLLRAIELGDTRFDAAWRAANPEAFERIRRFMDPANDPGAGEPGREQGGRRQLEARRHHDTWERLPEIRCPTLLCGGRYDGIAPPANMENLARRIPDARLELFEGGHLFLVQDPRSWESILAFFGAAPAEPEGKPA